MHKKNTPNMASIKLHKSFNKLKNIDIHIIMSYLYKTKPKIE